MAGHTRDTMTLDEALDLLIVAGNFTAARLRSQSMIAGSDAAKRDADRMASRYERAADLVREQAPSIIAAMQSRK